MNKLHLGCGQQYLDGYINIDFPLSEHSVQKESVADEHYDITMLTYPISTIQEVRLHHVFEHFERAIACALVASWNSWLVEKGVLHIEVPDFEKTAKAALGKFKNMNKKKVAIRHLFGSHEAKWAIHAEGYSEWMLRDMLVCFGFEVVKVIKQDWRGTYNIEIIAEKVEHLTKRESSARAEKYLKGFLLDDSEKILLTIWIEQFNRQKSISWAT